MSAAVQVRGLTKRYRAVTVLDDVSVELAVGRVHLLVSPNGAGKTTLLRVLAGLARPTSGSVRICGRPVSSLERPAEVVGACLDPIRLPALRSDRQHLACLATAARLPRQRVDEVLDLVGLPAQVASRRAGTYSLGTRQRLTLAAAPRTARAIDLATGERADGPIFLAADGRRLDRHRAGRIVGRVARRAGITKKVSPHTLRHAFITAALDAGVPMRDVQEAASHSDPRTTMRYDRARGSLDRHATYVVAPTSRAPPGKPPPARSSSAWRSQPPGGQARGHPMMTAPRRLRTATSIRTGTAQCAGDDASAIITRAGQIRSLCVGRSTGSAELTTLGR